MFSIFYRVSGGSYWEGALAERPRQEGRLTTKTRRHEGRNLEAFKLGEDVQLRFGEEDRGRDALDTAGGTRRYGEVRQITARSSGLQIFMQSEDTFNRHNRNVVRKGWR